MSKRDVDDCPEYTRGECIYLGRTASSLNETLHIERYRFALSLIRDGQVVLDAASGSGYGTELLAQRAAHVTGLELNGHALSFALSHHARPNVNYIRADLNHPIQLPDESVEVVVCLETVEHITAQLHLMAEFRRLLRPGGTLIISTPDRDARTFRNRFHVHELSRVAFVQLIKTYFAIEGLYGQFPLSWSPLHTIWRVMAGFQVFELGLRLAAHLPGVRALRWSALSAKHEEPGPITRTAVEARRSHVFLIAVATRPAICGRVQ